MCFAGSWTVGHRALGHFTSDSTGASRVSPTADAGDGGLGTIKCISGPVATLPLVLFNQQQASPL